MTGAVLLITGALALIGAGIGGVIWLRRREVASREAFEALAAQRGWSLNISNQTLGRPAILRLSARSGTHWTAEARKLAAAGTSGKSAIQTTEFRSPEPAWPDGLIVIGPALPPGGAALTEQLLDGLDNTRGRKLIGRLAGADMSEAMAALRPMAAPDGLTMLASSDPGHAVDLPAIARLIREWEPQHPGDKGHPIIIFGADGLRLRLRHGTSTADRMERFIDLALAIGRVLERR